MTVERRVGLVFGGRSVEHEVSVVSARGVADALARTRLHCVPIGVTHDGRWLSTRRSQEILDGDALRAEVDSAGDDGVCVALDPGGGGLLLAAPGRPTERLDVDVVFPLIHGWGGEDGRLQGALELAGIPYVGSGVFGSAAGMDKVHAKHLFEAHGLPVVPWNDLTVAEYERDPDAIENRIAATLRFPAFVKPANGGSSVGVSRVSDRPGLRAAIELAFAHDRKVIVERGLDAREIECAVVGNDEPESSGLGEIVPSAEFYDYAAKYEDGTSELIIPADLEAGLTRKIREMASTAFRALDLCGFARVDFLLERGTDRVCVNEANTLPGFTPISMFPKLWEAAGLEYPRLVERLVELGVERAAAEGRRRVRRDP